MAMKLLEEWNLKNFAEGEMSQYYEENSFTEYELYKLYEEKFVQRNKNYTLVKGILSNVTYDNRMKDPESDFSKITKEFIREALFLSFANLSLSYLDIQNLDLRLGRTHDCHVSFLGHIPLMYQKFQQNINEGHDDRILNLWNEEKGFEIVDKYFEYLNLSSIEGVIHKKYSHF